MEGSVRRFGAGIYHHGWYEFGHRHVITRTIIDTDEEHSAQVARLVSGVVGLIEH
ncbi:hypothetical protein [Gynuella sp.]|uniref:hypothetical protein n=1 Tax=Gynuella sp. TaxID=2969146 RepID=UPI003D138421